MEKNSKICLFLMLLFFLSYSIYGYWLLQTFGTINNSNDFFTHFERSKGNESIPYAPLYSLFFSDFSSSEFYFYEANLALLAILIPFLLYLLTKSYWSNLVYFCGIGFFHQSVFAALFPAALVFAYFLFYLYNRNPFSWIVLACLAGLTHSFGIPLFLCIGIIETLAFLLKNKHFETNWFSSIILGPAQLQTASLPTIFLNILPLPVIFFGIKTNLFYFCLIVFSFIASFTELRALALAQIVFCLTIPENIKNSDWNFKKAFLVFLIAQLAYYLVVFAIESQKLLKYS